VHQSVYSNSLGKSQNFGGHFVHSHISMQKQQVPTFFFKFSLFVNCDHTCILGLVFQSYNTQQLA